jgi:hypothetical protein
MMILCLFLDINNYYIQYNYMKDIDYFLNMIIRLRNNVDDLIKARKQSQNISDVYISNYINSLIDVTYIHKSEIKYNNPLSKKNLDDDIYMCFFKSNINILKYNKLDDLKYILENDDIIKSTLLNKKGMVLNLKKNNYILHHDPSNINSDIFTENYNLQHNKNIPPNFFNALWVTPYIENNINYNLFECNNHIDILGLNRSWGDYIYQYIIKCKLRDLFKPCPNAHPTSQFCMNFNDNKIKHIDERINNHDFSESEKYIKLKYPNKNIDEYKNWYLEISKKLYKDVPYSALGYTFNTKRPTNFLLILANIFNIKHQHNYLLYNEIYSLFQKIINYFGSDISLQNKQIKINKILNAFYFNDKNKNNEIGVSEFILFPGNYKLEGIKIFKSCDKNRIKYLDNAGYELQNKIVNVKNKDIISGGYYYKYTKYNNKNKNI